MKYLRKKGIFCLLFIGALFCMCNEKDPEVKDETNEKLTTRYRGIHMYHEAADGPKVPDADIDKVGNWNVNLIRWWLMWWAMPDNVTQEQYRQFIYEQCDVLDTKLPVFKRNGIKVCLVMGSYPGGKVENGSQWPPHKVFYDGFWQDEFVWIWEYIAKRYKDEETIVMYDLMNEPNAGDGSPKPLFLTTAKAIRAIDTEKELVYEPGNESDYSSLQPFDIPGILYSVHVYYPHALTHQGILSEGPPFVVSYPGNIENEYWNAARLREHYRVIKRFADTYHVRIFVGEFGCVHFAPNNSAYHYMKDCIEFFEEAGWDWIHFSLEPECSGNWGATAWCAEYDTIYKSYCKATFETDRLQLLKSYYAKNPH